MFSLFFTNRYLHRFLSVLLDLARGEHDCAPDAIYVEHPIADQQMLDIIDWRTSLSPLHLRAKTENHGRVASLS